MRRALSIAIITAVVSSCLPASGEFAPTDDKEKERTVWLHVEGPESSVQYLQELLQANASKYGLVMTDDRSKAGIIFQIKAREGKEKKKPVYTAAIASTLSLPDVPARNVYACRYISESNGKSPANFFLINEYLVPPPRPEANKVFLEEDKDHLSDALSRHLVKAGYQVVASEADAAMKLTNIHLVLTTVQTVTQTLHVDVNFSMGKSGISFFNDLSLYKSIVEPMNPEAESCRGNIQSMIRTSIVTNYSSVLGPPLGEIRARLTR